MRKNSGVMVRAEIATIESEQAGRYRALMAAVLYQAVIDCDMDRKKEYADCIDAYRWVQDAQSTVAWYCGWLEIDPGEFRRRFLTKFKGAYHDALTLRRLAELKLAQAAEKAAKEDCG